MSSRISKNSFDNIKEVIKVINELRDIGLQTEIQLPKIVAIGVQSSGKSSLLESITRIDLLPRGSGIVTRCPLEIRFIEDRSQDKDFKPQAYFFEEQDQKYEDFQEVKKRIEALSYEKAGNKIVDEVITLTIIQTKCPTQNLIDLPGMISNSIEDQENVKKLLNK
ncbi:hypothetical protein ABPG72_017087 [Tetrahymena utriculariae]